MNRRFDKQVQEMVRKGATKGMIKSALVKQGATPEQIDDLFVYFKKTNTARIRRNGALAAASGIAIVAFGCVQIALVSTGGPKVGRIPLISIVLGIIFAVKGLVTLTSGVED